jgi:Lamin Tail Domain
MKPISSAPSSGPSPSPSVDDSLFAIVINEMMVKPGSDGLPMQWIELYNNGPTTVNLKSWTIQVSAATLKIPSNLKIAPREYLVLCNKDGVHPFTPSFYWPGLEMDDFVDEIQLLTPDAELHDHVAWDNSQPWNSEWYMMDGVSLALKSPEAYNNAASSWCFSSTSYVTGRKGTPGAANDCVPTPGTIVINEIMADSNGGDDSNQEWFEIINTGFYAVNLKNWRVVKPGGKWKISTELMIPPGGFVVFNGENSDIKPSSLFQNYTLKGFELDSDEDKISLISPDTDRHDAVEWNPTWNSWNNAKVGASMALYSPSSNNADAENWCTSEKKYSAMNKGTPGSDNDCTVASPNTIVINEIMMAPWDQSNDKETLQWVELHNRGRYGVNMMGWTISVVGKPFWTISEKVVIPPNGYLVLSGATETDYPHYKLVGFALNKDEGSIYLKTPQGVVHDKILWDVDIDKAWSQLAGSSMALKSPELNNNRADSWCKSAIAYAFPDKGTPGTANDCVKIIIHELMLDPAGESSTGAWVELYNAGAYPVNLKDWYVGIETENGMGGSASMSAIEENVIISAGGYIVISNSTTYDYQLSGLDLVSTRGVVSLAAPDFSLHDAVEWGASWTQVRGQAMALRSAEMDNHVAALASWCGAHTEYERFNTGTPGQPNDCPKIVINEIMIDPFGADTSANEWIELYNPSPYQINLKNWVLAVSSPSTGGFYPIANDLFVQPGGYLVMGGGALANVVLGGLQFDNQQGTVALAAPDGTAQVSVEWNTDENTGWTQKVGSSMALKMPGLDDGKTSSWCRSSTIYDATKNKGTPGQSNDCNGYQAFSRVL